MKYCKQCGKLMADSLRKCPYCGAASDNQSFSKWQMGLIACNVIAVLTMFMGWMKISLFGISKTISPIRLAGYLQDTNSTIGYYLQEYSGKINLLLLCGACLLAAYVVSVVLILMKKNYAFLVGLVAHLVMLFVSWKVVSVGKQLADYTYNAVSVSGIVYFVLVLSLAAAAMCGYVMAVHPESA